MVDKFNIAQIKIEQEIINAKYATFWSKGNFAADGT